MKLPKIVLKKFDGNPTNFQSFWDSYNTAIHENEDISDVNKMDYLSGLLGGPAYSAVKGFTMTSGNYKEVIDVLHERFGSKDVIISSHMDALLKLPFVYNSDTKRLRSVYDLIEQNIRGLKTLGISNKEYGSLLLPILMSRLPQEFKLILTRNVPKDEWSLDSLLLAFKEELEAREKCVQLNASAAAEKGKVITKGQFPVTAQALVAEQVRRKKQGSTNNLYCAFCNQAHQSTMCPIITDPRARREALKRAGKCYNWLRPGHLSRSCQSKATCFTSGLKHHSSICSQNMMGKGIAQASSTNAMIHLSPQLGAGLPYNTENNQSKPVTTAFINQKSGVLLQTASAAICRPDKPEASVQARILFDSGSQKSYVSQRLKEALSLKPIHSETLVIKTFGSTDEMVQTCDNVQLCVQGVNGLNLYLTANTVPVICAPLQNQCIELSRDNIPHLQGLKLANNSFGHSELEIDLLVGADFYWTFIMGRIIRGEYGPTTVESHVGWILSGPSCFLNLQATFTNLSQTHVLKVSESSLADDSIKEENSVHESFLANIKFDRTRYEVKLPFKEVHPVLPDNFRNSVARLGSLLRRLKQDPEVLQEYNAVFMEQSSKGMIEDVTDKMLPAGGVHYIPHHALIREDKETTKLRIVFDASSKTEGVSLNGCLNSGPCLVPNLFDVLLHFRCHQIALVSDIEKAFLQVSIAPEHRDFLCFLWVSDVNEAHPKIVIKRMTRTMFVVTSSPFVLGGTLQHHISKYEEEDPEIVKKLLESFYVDDFNSGEENVDLAFELYLKSKKILSDG